MKKLLLSTLFFFTILSISLAQAPGVQWRKELSFFPYFTRSSAIYEMTRVKNGGFIFAGTDSMYGFDKYKILNKELGGRAIITKTDTAGNTIWSSNLQNYPYNSFYNCVTQSVSGEFIAAGSTTDYIDTLSRLTISRYKNNGVLVWNKNFGGVRSNPDSRISESFAQSVIQSNDGNFVVAGYTNANNGDVSGNHGIGTFDFWVIKIDTAGNLLWQKCFGGSGDDKAYAIQQTSDGGYLVVGTDSSIDGNVSTNKGVMDAWVIKLDSAGNLQWEKSFGGSLNDAFKSFLQNPDGSYILTGYTYSNDKDVTGNQGDADIWVVKIDASGKVLWQKCVGGTIEDYGASIERTTDGTYLIAGHTDVSNGNVRDGGADIWVIRIDDNGNLVWGKTVGTDRNDFGVGIKEISESSFLIAGNGDAAIVNPQYGIYTTGSLYKLGNSNLITGAVFIDYNRNGIKETGEPFASNVIVKSEKLGYTRAAIPYNGSFKIDVDTGTYKTSAIINTPYYTVVPASATSVFSSYFNSDSISFAVQQIPNKRDLSINLSALMPARPGFQTTYRIFYKNQGTDTITNGTIEFISNKLSIVSSSPAYSSISGDTIRWNYENLKPEDAASITIDLKVDAPPSVSINDLLTSVATISPAAKDETPSDDTSKLIQRVVGSYDPNDKKEKNGGTITQAQVSNGDYLLYTVRFQNTGTDTAFNIVIRDTLSDKVDWNTLEMVSSSHSYQFNINEGDKLTWSFNNIALPDSTVDEPGSQGYIVYRIKPKTSLLPGDTISNTASIYFDFNLPIQTNTEKTVVEGVLLPVKLTGFTATRNGKQNEIAWNISKELNVAKFEVERSSTGRDFMKIGTIKATNNSNYETTDLLPVKAINYYRLKIIYKDGTFEYSSVKSVNNSGSFFVSIYPNPVRNNLLIRINNERKANISIKITGMDGNIIRTLKYTVSEGSMIKNINVSSLSKGSYFLLVSSETEQAGIKFEKL